MCSFNRTLQFQDKKTLIKCKNITNLHRTSFLFRFLRFHQVVHNLSEQGQRYLFPHNALVMPRSHSQPGILFDYNRRSHFHSVIINNKKKIKVKKNPLFKICHVFTSKTAFATPFQIKIPYTTQSMSV